MLKRQHGHNGLVDCLIAGHVLPFALLEPWQPVLAIDILLQLSRSLELVQALFLRR